MSTKYLIPALLVSLLAGCASNQVASTDPVRACVVADLDQALDPLVLGRGPARRRVGRDVADAEHAELDAAHRCLLR